MQGFASIQQFNEEIHLHMALIADRHPAGTPAKLRPGLLRAAEIKPAQLIG
jgi:hypothetical protein